MKRTGSAAYSSWPRSVCDLPIEGRAMGKGDVKTKKGKRFQGSYGKSRSHKAWKKTPETGRLRG